MTLAKLSRRIPLDQLQGLIGMACAGCRTVHGIVKYVLVLVSVLV